VIERRLHNMTQTRRAVPPADLQRDMASTPPDDDPSYTWRDERRGVAVVVSVVGASHCQVAMLDGGRWHDLVESDSAEQVWVSLAGIPGVVPRASVVPCRRGLEVLQAVTGDAGFDGLRGGYRWRPAPDWVGDRRGYLLRDVVEVLWDAALELWERIVLEGPAADTGPVGLRHLAHLLGLHHRVVSAGLDGVRAELPPDRLDAAVRAAGYLGLADLPGVLHHGDDDAYERLVSPDGEDASAIRAAVQRRLDVAPDEFGVSDVPQPVGTDFLA
jgi:hypothetical protein